MKTRLLLVLGLLLPLSASATGSADPLCEAVTSPEPPTDGFRRRLAAFDDLNEVTCRRGPPNVLGTGLWLVVGTVTLLPLLDGPPDRGRGLLVHAVLHDAHPDRVALLLEAGVSDSKGLVPAWAAAHERWDLVPEGASLRWLDLPRDPARWPVILDTLRDRDVDLPCELGPGTLHAFAALSVEGGPSGVAEQVELLRGRGLPASCVVPAALPGLAPSPERVLALSDAVLAERRPRPVSVELLLGQILQWEHDTLLSRAPALVDAMWGTIRTRELLGAALEAGEVEVAQRLVDRVPFGVELTHWEVEAAVIGGARAVEWVEAQQAELEPENWWQALRRALAQAPPDGVEPEAWRSARVLRVLESRPEDLAGRERTGPTLGTDRLTLPVAVQLLDALQLENDVLRTLAGNGEEAAVELLQERGQPASLEVLADGGHHDRLRARLAERVPTPIQQVYLTCEHPYTLHELSPLDDEALRQLAAVVSEPCPKPRPNAVLSFATPLQALVEVRTLSQWLDAGLVVAQHDLDAAMDRTVSRQKQRQQGAVSEADLAWLPPLLDRGFPPSAGTLAVLAEECLTAHLRPRPDLRGSRRWAVQAADNACRREVRQALR